MQSALGLRDHFRTFHLWSPQESIWGKIRINSSKPASSPRAPRTGVIFSLSNATVTKFDKTFGTTVPFLKFQTLPELRKEQMKQPREKCRRICTTRPTRWWQDTVVPGLELRSHQQTTKYENVKRTAPTIYDQKTRTLPKTWCVGYRKRSSEVYSRRSKKVIHRANVVRCTEEKKCAVNTVRADVAPLH